jgi:hypothetical protein
MARTYPRLHNAWSIIANAARSTGDSAEVEVEITTVFRPSALTPVRVLKPGMSPAWLQ